MNAARRPMFVANWKMHKTCGEARSYVAEFAELLHRPQGSHLQSEIVLAPPYTALEATGNALRSAGLSERIGLCAQNIYSEPQGAYTGEISLPMVAEHGVRYVIVGHSERRNLFGEGGPLISQKLRAVSSGGLCPILCIGENLEDRESGRAESVVLSQLESALEGVPSAERLVVAYEPVWAIGTGKNAEPSDAAAIHHEVRRRMEKRYGNDAASHLRILYGGSVTQENIGGFMREPEVDGALVGGASLAAGRFGEILRNGEKSHSG
jgi:triosephosphate isomerase